MEFCCNPGFEICPIVCKGVIVYYQQGVGNFGPEFSKKLQPPFLDGRKIATPLPPACRHCGSVSSQVFKVVEDTKMTFSR